MKRHFRPSPPTPAARALPRPKRGLFQRSLSFAEETAIFLAAFAAVVVIQIYVFPAVGANNRYFLLNGNYVAVGVTMLFTFGLGAILRYLLILTFRMQFKRGPRA